MDCIPSRWSSRGGNTEKVACQIWYQNRAMQSGVLLLTVQGPIIRIAPNEVAIADPTAIKTIYSISSGFTKVCSIFFWVRNHDSEKPPQLIQFSRLTSTRYSVPPLPDTPISLPIWMRSLTLAGVRLSIIYIPCPILFARRRISTIVPRPSWRNFMRPRRREIPSMCPCGYSGMFPSSTIVSA